MQETGEKEREKKFGTVTIGCKTNDPVGFQWEQIISAPLNATPNFFVNKK